MNSPQITPEFEALLDYLKHERGCDLTGYKRATLMRRFEYRMQSLEIGSYQGYLQYLRSHSEEYLALLEVVLINVTSFFRDQETWDYLAAEVIPQIIASKQPDEPIRVWSAGCATGQEIYSLLILLAEAIGIESCVQRVQCYATDVDEAILAQARQATFSDLRITNVPSDWLQKYFQATEQGYVFHPSLRRTVVFGRHDLVKDAPMSRIDLLICRNVLIYFNLETQASLLVRFHFALKTTGFLFLGKSETLILDRKIFTPINLKHRIYAKGLNLELKDHLSLDFKLRQQENILTIQKHFWQTATETSPIAQFAVDAHDRLIGANEQANLLFGLTLDDWKHPFYELEPGKLIASHTSRKFNTYPYHSVVLKDVQRNTPQGTQYFEVTIAPVLNAKRQLLGITLAFLDQTNCKQLAQQLQWADAELERMSECLEATQSELEVAHQKMQLLDQARGLSRDEES
ncbi:CheR family methyltransferase [Egbenema bharatensis]|uniref:CheR family methyltransferase n=1 Tax=Egbenema bharatensis TaxID=3463334 RepID=UPI003A8B0039